MKFWSLFRRRRKTTLLCINVADMWTAHPDTAWDRECETCHQKVGIYPSGQNVIQEYGKKNVKIICNRCADPFAWNWPLAKGAIEECGQGRPFKNKDIST